MSAQKIILPLICNKMGIPASSFVFLKENFPTGGHLLPLPSLTKPYTTFPDSLHGAVYTDLMYQMVSPLDHRSVVGPVLPLVGRHLASGYLQPDYHSRTNRATRSTGHLPCRLDHSGLHLRPHLHPRCIRPISNELV